MFHLEKLQINGFKSFYDKAELTFPAKMTAIVGPNGCGKSNICDAIIWVLGEHRASHIRGETMEDVIFGGSERRRALGMGEVTMTLSSTDEHPATEDGKLVIHRRVFRSGESEFRMNGKRVRFRDIADILMDTGLGIRNYSVMEQGKIDLIISNKPQDRRRLIEEAAGITKYKTKRRAAELKLDETQANLLRIDDTLSEVTRNLNSLKRQAAKARRHKDLFELLLTAKRSLYAGRIATARTEQESSTEGVTTAQNLESEAAALLAQDEAAFAETRRFLTERSQYASSLREELAKLGSESERLRSFLAQSETTLGDLEQRLESSQGQIASLEAEGSEQQTLLDEKTQSLEEAIRERNRLRAVADELEASRQLAAEAVRAGERTLSESREQLMKTIARITESRNQVHQLEIAVEKCEFYLGKLEDARRRVSENRDGAEARVHEAELALTTAEAHLADSQHHAKTSLESWEQLAARRDAIRESLAGARDVISQTTYRIDSLRALLVSLESQDEDVRAAVLELAPGAESAAEAVRAAEGFESALDALLRDTSKAIALDTTDLAVEAITRLRERGAGRGTFIALDFRPATGEFAAGSAAQAILGEGPIADAVRAAVPDAYLVSDLKEAIVRARMKPSATFVTRDGDMVRGPLMQGGKAEGATPGVFSIKRQLRDLEQILGDEEVRASGLATEIEGIEEELHAAEDTRILADERRRQAEEQLREQTANRARIAEELVRIEKDLAVASEESALYEEEKVKLLQQRDNAAAELANLEGNEKTLQTTIQTTETALRTGRVEFESATEVASTARIEVEAASGNVNSIHREHENLARIVASLRARSAAILSEIENLQRRRAETISAVDSSRAELQRTLESLASLGERRIAIEEEVAALDEKTQALEASAVAGRERWNASRVALFEAERRLDRARAAFDLIREQVSLDLHAGLDALADVEPPADEEARSHFESEVNRLADQLEKIGPVNVLAIDEYTEIEERERFLRTQRDDLVQAIESLRTTIRKINLTSRELFREAFAAVNQNFTTIFTSLFGGGTAAMQLLDEDDVLESGIELIAQPPGKKTQSIALLSGGERALTALALLFSIFKYKPSPFCILDEVDAPLDEVNNERFVRLVREMARETQFIVITHSRRTMEAADILYGVTMEEAGCSRMVSVNFADFEA